MFKHIYSRFCIVLQLDFHAIAAKFDCSFSYMLV